MKEQKENLEFDAKESPREFLDLLSNKSGIKEKPITTEEKKEIKDFSIDKGDSLGNKKRGRNSSSFCFNHQFSLH